MKLESRLLLLVQEEVFEAHKANYGFCRTL
jgi:hypothetical protein